MRRGLVHSHLPVRFVVATKKDRFINGGIATNLDIRAAFSKYAMIEVYQRG